MKFFSKLLPYFSLGPFKNMFLNVSSLLVQRVSSITFPLSNQISFCQFTFLKFIKSDKILLKIEKKQFSEILYSTYCQTKYRKNSKQTHELEIITLLYIRTEHLKNILFFLWNACRTSKQKKIFVWKRKNTSKRLNFENNSMFFITSHHEIL